MDVSALSYSTPLARAGQTGKSAAADAARSETGATGQASSPATAQPVGLYISPVLRYDQSARVAVLFFRDFDTGETRDQIPAERVVEQYRRTGGPPQTTEEQRSAASGDSGYGANSAGGGEVWAETAAATDGASVRSQSLGESFLAAGNSGAPVPQPSGAGEAAVGASASGVAASSAGSLISLSV